MLWRKPTLQMIAGAAGMHISTVAWALDPAGRHLIASPVFGPILSCVEDALNQDGQGYSALVASAGRSADRALAAANADSESFDDIAKARFRTGGSAKRIVLTSLKR